MKRTGTGTDIQLVTWEDGYKALMEKPNVALFSTALTPERKPLIQWVGPIAFLDTNLYTRKGSKLGIKRLEDAKKLPKILVVKDYYTEQLLRKEGFSNLESVATEEIAIRKLLNGEAQLFPSNNITMPALLKKVNATMDDVESVLNLSMDMIIAKENKCCELSKLSPELSRLRMCPVVSREGIRLLFFTGSVEPIRVLHQRWRVYL